MDLAEEQCAQEGVSWRDFGEAPSATGRFDVRRLARRPRYVETEAIRRYNLGRVEVLVQADCFRIGHMDVRTTMICTHVLNRGGRGVYSLADELAPRPDER